MALDKQKILNELGSVVNQLQSADCGCMGKLFSNSGPSTRNAGSIINDYHGGMHNCCGHHGHHSCNAPCAGEPYSGARRCMGSCNPPKLYADTYNYLNQNMMQPVVQEVYDDLKSISPANTVLNNPMAVQMGLSQKSNPNQGNIMPENVTSGHSAGCHNNHVHTPHLHFDNTHSVNNDNLYFKQNTQQERTSPIQQRIGQPSQRMDQTKQGMMTGMGPQIVNMMNSNISKSSVQEQSNSNSSEIGQQMSDVSSDAKAEQYRLGRVQNNASYIDMNNLISGNNAMPATTPISQPNMAGNLHQYKQAGNAGTNPQTNSPNIYGQHRAGISKFNEMFPGIMKEDLGFDPMAIAIQMNPANQQRAAMDTMKKMMTNKSGGINNILNSPVIHPLENARNGITTTLPQSNQQLMGQISEKQNIKQEQQIIPTDFVQSSETIQKENNAITEAPSMKLQEVPNQQYLQQLSDEIRHIPNQSLLGSLPTVPEGAKLNLSTQRLFHENVTQPATPSRYIYKEPILPADTSRNLLQSHHFMKAPAYDYNTIGQPVHMIPPANYQTVDPILPQGISGQVVPMKSSNVKATISKTALVGTRPIGNTPSRSQLHHLYNQCKGSHSFAQQNIRQAGFTGSNSEGRINVPETAKALAPQYIERVGGDTVDNDEIKVAAKEQQNLNDIGDVPTVKKELDYSPMTRARIGKTRNGLQDQVFSSYPTSAKWSFHGTTPAPYSVGYRFRRK